ncbi:FMN-binding protein [Lacrimispora sp.]|uniref:FMN-binding protein n=1 Tax=Lacrimispora sp. TaxID=2719234 RepID=UPI002FD91EAE
MKKGNANAKRNGYIGLGAMVILAGAAILGSDSLYNAIDSKARPAVYTPGTYTGTAKGYGGMVTVEVTVTDKAIQSIEVDGEKETLLSMVVPSFTDAIVKKQSTEVDAVSGATLSSDAIKEAVDQALAQARGEAPKETEKAEEPGSTDSVSWKDGTYTYEAPEFDKNGYKDLVELTIKDQTITSLTWDCLKEDGTKKSQLSMDGKYVMTENGPKWHEQAEELVKYVMDNQSVEGLMNADGYTDTIASVSIDISGFVNGVKDCLRQASEGSSQTALKDGTYTYEAPEFDKNGYKDFVEMTIKDQTITALTWDCLKEDGSKKSQLSMDGKYVMTENGPKWHEQAEELVKYVMDNQSVEGLMNADGYTDTIASVSIDISGFVNGVKNCLLQASEGSAETSLKDGTYTYEAPEFDKNGYKDFVEMTIKDQTITALTWDCLKEDGSKKSQLSMDGKYVMTENGPKWHEQAEALVKYVMENQSVEGLMNADGYTDTIASVSIDISGFVNGVKDCLRQASGGSAEAALQDGTYTYEAPEFDKNGYKDLVEMTIKDQTITALTWDCLKEDGSKKSQLSMDGKYVMTENGPKWHEQAEALVKYVMENQSVEGLMNADGYTDTIASVSIDISGFVNGVKDCLSQASQKTAGNGALEDGTYTYEGAEFDKNGYKDLVVMTIKDKTITALTWDCLKEDGSKKSQLSMDGKYVMTENGPKWHEQAEELAKYVLDKQTVEGLMNADGYTDAIASVSIDISGFVNGVKDCLSQASQK